MWMCNLSPLEPVRRQIRPCGSAIAIKKGKERKYVSTTNTIAGCVAADNSNGGSRGHYWTNGCFIGIVNIYLRTCHGGLFGWIDSRVVVGELCRRIFSNINQCGNNPVADASNHPSIAKRQAAKWLWQQTWHAAMNAVCWLSSCASIRLLARIKRISSKVLF